MTPARLSIAVLLALGAAPALAHGPFDGFWAFDPEICENERGTTDLVPIMIDLPVIEGYESHCVMDRIERIAEGETWYVDLTCTGEGETWTRETLFALDRDVDGNVRRLIEIDLEFGTATVFSKCD